MQPFLCRWMGRIALALIVLLGWTGCANLTPVTPPTGNTQEFRGRFSVVYQTDASENPQGMHGNFHWMESGEHIQIELSSPLGPILARISVTPQQAQLVTAQGETRQAPDVDALTEQGLGWRMPVSGLRYWLKGQAAPRQAGQAESTLTRDEQGRLRSLQQADWQVAFQSPSDTSATPSQLRIEYVGSGPRKVSLKLALQD